MKISLFLPVVTLREKKMPFYLSSIGTAVYQTVVHRPFGIEDHQLLYMTLIIAWIPGTLVQMHCRLLNLPNIKNYHIKDKIL